MPAASRALLRTLALCAVLAFVILASALLHPHVPPVVAFAAMIAIGIPLLIAIQRGWTRVLWARRLDQARAKAEQAPLDPEPHYELGVLSNLHGDLEGAKAAFQRAREIAPKHAPSAVGLAHVLAQEEDLDRALALFTEAAEADPQLFAAHYGIAGVHQRREQYARAVQAYERALALEPDDAYVLAELARCRFELGDVKLAAQLRERAAALGVKDHDLDRQIRDALSDEP